VDLIVAPLVGAVGSSMVCQLRQDILIATITLAETGNVVGDMVVVGDQLHGITGIGMLAQVGTV
jgi:hypothetical protein